MHDDTAKTTEKKAERDKHIGGVAVEISSVWTPQIEAASRNKTGGETAAKRPEVCLLESKRTVD